VTALDVLRALARTPDAADALLAEIDAAGGDRRIADAATRLRGALKEAAGDPEGGQRRARQLAGQVAVTLQAALLARFAPEPVADAYLRSRLDAGAAAGPAIPFGSLPGGLDLTAILDRTSVTGR
jgi:putative acyl-CoA dehydrogenase